MLYPLSYEGEDEKVRVGDYLRHPASGSAAIGSARGLR